MFTSPGRALAYIRYRSTDTLLQVKIKDGAAYINGSRLLPFCDNFDAAAASAKCVKAVLSAVSYLSSQHPALLPNIQHWLDEHSLATEDWNARPTKLAEPTNDPQLLGDSDLIVKVSRLPGDLLF